jgi:hypothetical protein
MGGISRSRVMNKGVFFFILGRDNLLCFFSAFSGFKPSLGLRHEDLGKNFIL